MAQLLIATIFFIIGYMGFIRALWAIMQPEQLIDKLTKGRWSKWLDARYAMQDSEGRYGNDFFVKILGGCEQCTSFWWVLPYMVFYVLGIKELFGWPLSAVASFFWMCLFWFITSLAGLIILQRKK